MIGSYSCKKCDHVIEYQKPYGIEFPEKLKRDCDVCKKKTVFLRNYGAGISTLVFEVGEGLCGNSKNGYEKGVTYMPAGMSPLNKVYGPYGRSSIFDPRTGF